LIQEQLANILPEKGRERFFQPHPPQNISKRLKIEVRKIRSDEGGGGGEKKKPSTLSMVVTVRSPGRG